MRWIIGGCIVAFVLLCWLPQPALAQQQRTSYCLGLWSRPVIVTVAASGGDGAFREGLARISDQQRDLAAQLAEASAARRQWEQNWALFQILRAQEGRLLDAIRECKQGDPEMRAMIQQIAANQERLLQAICAAQAQQQPIVVPTGPTNGGGAPPVMPPAPGTMNYRQPYKTVTPWYRR